MLKYRFRLFALGAVLMPLFLHAQNDSKAKKILDETSKKYKSFNIIKADFVYTLENPQAKVKDSKKGTLYVKSKMNKYKLLVADNEVISDGKLVWKYSKAEKEVELNEVENNAKAINPAAIFTVYEKGFKYLYVGDVSVLGVGCSLVELSPIDEKKNYFKIKLSVEKASKLVKEIVVFDKNGSRYTYTIKKMDVAPKVNESIFTFDTKQYPGVEVVDLR